MCYALMVVAAGLLGGADEARPTDPLVGTWKIVSMTTDGRDSPGAKDGTVTFADSKMTLTGKQGRSMGSYMIDAKKKPATIDFVPGGRPPVGTMKGIFAVDQGSLKLCLGQPGKDRPTRLTSKAGDETTALVLKRVENK
jgi:uncharacterized protein (TIGR03067 family)